MSQRPRVRRQPTMDELASEADWLSWIVDYAKLRGWRVAHFRPAMDGRRGGRWRTAMDGDTGFPDLVLARRGRVLFLEAKRESGTATIEQLGWIDAINGPKTDMVTAEHGAMVAQPHDREFLLRLLR